MHRMKIKRIIDISGTISDRTTLWPGDEGVTLDRIQNIESGDSCNLSVLRMGTHTSTHVDAPLHFVAGGADTASVNLNKFIGFAKVFNLSTQDCIKASDLYPLNINVGDIVLFKTKNSFLDMNGLFHKGFVYLDESAARFLADKKVATVGIDYLSVESFYADNAVTHKLLLQNEIGIIEGLRLKDVQEGEYFLSCVPLKIEGADGSPVRAVLVEFD
ncbi:putative metal-dependent hydrolase [Acetivibrio clariflavus DSM 19732]|uniref:Kynurenine formamidase n=2 Tax=Acetivibrio clariflavus TaxID=288965 RepID=G8LTY3_ACECE|nr:putative metal-dependent hydrolase [Acetivibrio clariflavus DSM 19732]